MYLYAGSFSGLGLVWSIMQFKLGIYRPIGYGISVLYFACFGIFGNWLYYTHTNRKIAQIKRTYPEPEVQKRELVKVGGTNRLALGLVIVIMAIWSAAIGYKSYQVVTTAGLTGNKLTFNGGDLYYASSIKEIEVKKLGEYLTQGEIFDGSPKSIQVQRNRDIFEIRMVIKKGYDTNEKFVEDVRGMAVEISEQVFGNAPVDVHLCDSSFKTLRVLDFSKSHVRGVRTQHGIKLIFYAGELYYIQPVTESEAKKLGQYLVEINFFNETPKSVQMKKSGQRYQIGFVVKVGDDQDKEYIKAFKEFAVELSERVFQGAPVDIHLCDAEYFKTLRVVKFVN
jgi:hypothetical protein